jgi:DNA invertase Pin-like site-specific DNA recombinase
MRFKGSALNAVPDNLGTFMRAIVYIRELEGDYDRQRDQIIAYCLSNDIEIVSTHEDRGQAAMEPWFKRPGLTMLTLQLREKQEDPPIDCLIVESINRLTKDTDKYMAPLVAHHFSEMGIKVYDTTGKDLATPDGFEERLLFSVLDSIKGHEQDATQHRLRVGRMRRRYKEGKSGGRVKYGEQKGEAEVVQLIMNCYEKQHGTAQSIALELNDMLLHDGWPKPRYADQWSPKIVKRIISDQLADRRQKQTYAWQEW